ncbi:MAG: M24 family metallopeptidase, partial [Candidatus Gastranaerophilales bacterium]|nr:M24 family metallopeptidase [Candidatus Gastranaerophilales bacterium]
HEQADNEVNHEFVEVVKLPLDKSYLTGLTEIIPPYFKLGVIASKTSKLFYDVLLEKLKQKNTTVKLFSSDPVADYKKESNSDINYTVFKIDDDISGVTSDEKYNIIKECAGTNSFILVTSLEDIAYLTNMRSFNFVYSSVFPAKAIINQNGVQIFSDCTLKDIGEFYSVLPFSEFEHELKSIENSKIFIDDSQISINDYNLINKNNDIQKSHLKLLKTIKNDSELAHLKKCFERSDKALNVIHKMLASETIYSEYDYYEALVKSMKENGALSLSFKPIVAAGENTSIIHYTSPSKEKMVNNGDLLLIDYGGYYEGGYSTDTTRTFIKGEPNNEQKQAYTVVLKAFLNAYYKKYPKKSAYYSIDKTARDTIEKNAIQGFSFAHGTGHGVGISVHEIPPRVSSSNAAKTKIAVNTVFSIEPGIYKEEWGGIRLENTVFASLEDDKIIMNTLSHFPFEIKLVDFSILTDYEKYYYMKWQAEACIM